MKMTPLLIKSDNALRAGSGAFGYEIKGHENTLYIPDNLAKGIPNYVEGANATEAIQYLWDFPREVAGQLHCDVSSVQITTRDLVWTLVDSQLLDPSSLAFWDLGKPPQPEPSFF